MKNVALLLAVVAVVTLSVSAYAGEVKFNVDNGKWITPGNWSPAGPPTAADGAWINGERAATISAGETGNASSIMLGWEAGDPVGSRTPGHIVMDGGTLNTGCLNLRWGDGTSFTQTGGIVNVTDEGESLNIGMNGSVNAIYNLSGGTLNVTAASVDYGNLIMGNQGKGTFNLSGTGVLNLTGQWALGYWADGTAVATVNITGGAANVGDWVYIGYDNDNSFLNISDGSLLVGTLLSVGRSTPGTLKVSGGSAMITAYSFEQNSGDGTLVVEIDGSGISTIAVTDAASLAGTLTVVDDGAAPGTYTLMTYASVGGDFDTFSPPSGDWSYNVGDTSLTVTYVPEPATMALLGIGGIGVLIRRKQR